MTNIKRIKGIHFDDQGQRRDVDVYPYLEVLLVDGMIYRADIHDFRDGKLVGLYGANPEPLVADCDGRLGGFFDPAAGELARISLA